MIYAYFYRKLMKITHRYNWHYAPLFGPFEDGSTQRWCRWCGLRETYRPVAGFKSLRVAKPE
jgi:hypothetical protein